MSCLWKHGTRKRVDRLPVLLKKSTKHAAALFVVMLTVTRLTRKIGTNRLFALCVQICVAPCAHLCTKLVLKNGSVKLLPSCVVQDGFETGVISSCCNICGKNGLLTRIMKFARANVDTDTCAKIWLQMQSRRRMKTKEDVARKAVFLLAMSSTCRQAIVHLATEIIVLETVTQDRE